MLISKTMRHTAHSQFSKTPWHRMSVHRDSFESTYLMTKSYAQIVKQIESLKQEAEKARRKEIEGVVGRIRDAIAVYGLTADDLGLGPKAKRGRKPATPFKRGGAKRAKGAKAPAVVKFRNDAGGAWGGIGKRPQWLRDALAAGKQLSDFAVK